MENKNGRNREGNFSPSEVESLVDICTEYKNILENKSTNAVTWKRKAEIWDVIATAFNATTQTGEKTWNLNLL